LILTRPPVMARQQVRADLDPIRQNLIVRAVKLVHPLDHQRIRARAFDVRAHRHQALRQIHHLRFAGGVFDDRGATGQHGGHQQVFGAGDCDQIQHDMRAFQAVGAGADVAVLDLDLRSHGFQALDVQVDRPRADGATAGQRHVGLTEARDQRPQHQNRRAHGPNQFVGRLKGLDGAGIDLDVHPLVHHQIHAHPAQQLHGGSHVLKVRDVADRDRSVGQQGGGQNRQHRVLRAGRPQFAPQGDAAVDDQFAHGLESSVARDCCCRQTSGVWVLRERAWISSRSIRPPKAA